MKLADLQKTINNQLAVNHIRRTAGTVTNLFYQNLKK